MLLLLFQQGDFLQLPLDTCWTDRDVRGELTHRSSFEGTARFEVRRKLGEGGMGAVYEVFDRRRGVCVALKTIPHVEPAGIYRLKKEFRAVAELHHANLVTLHELVNDGDDWFFTMELIVGESFIRWVRGDTEEPKLVTVSQAGLDWLMEESSAPAQPIADASFDEQRLRDALLQLASCVHAVHEAGQLHRDLKPSNVLVASDGRVSVLDFGLAHSVGSRVAYASLESAIVGTPAFMAPEQAAGEPVTSATDWYSVGVMLYQALTGLVPFGGSILQQITSKQIAAPPHPADLVRGLPDDLAALAADLLRRDPTARPTGNEVMRRLSVGDAPQFADAAQARGIELFGHERELEVLKDTFALARRAPQLAVISGAPGAGKTTLLRRFLASVPEETVVLAGRCREHESVPFKALDALVDHLARYLQHLPVQHARALLPPGVRSLARVFPVLDRVGAIAGVDDEMLEVPDPMVFRQRAFGAFRDLLSAISLRCPLVLVVDDAHWGDGDSAALLEHVLRPPDPPALMVVLVHRGGEADTPLLRHIVGRDQLGLSPRLLELAPLAEVEAAQLAEALLEGEASASSELARGIALKARGNPELIAELCRHVTRHGERVAPRLADVFLARIEGLDEAQRLVLDVLAVAGPLAGDVVARAVGLDIDAARVVASLSAARAVRSVPTPGEDREMLDVYHDRIRRVLTAGYNQADLRGLHGRVASALPHDADAEQAAHHLERSGDPQGAAQRLIHVALEAAHGLAFDRRARLLQHALALLDEDEPRRAWLLELLGDALASGGRSAEAAEVYAAAAVALERRVPQSSNAGRPSNLGRPQRSTIDLQRVAAEHLLRSGRVDEGLAAMRRVLDALNVRMPASPRGALASTLYHRARLALRGLEARDTVPASVGDHQRMVMDACWSMAMGQSMVDTIAGADFHARHLRFALDAGDEARLARALALEAAHVASAGADGHERALELLQRSEELGARLGDAHALGLAKLMRGLHALFTSRWGDAVALTDEAVAILRDNCVNVAWEIASASRFNMGALYYQGRVAEMSRRLPGALADARARGDRFAESCIRSGSSVVVWLARGELDVAERQLADEAQRWGEQRFALQHLLALQGHTYVDLFAGRAAAAAERLERNLKRLERSQLMRVQLLRHNIWGLRARVALATGHLDETTRYADRLDREGVASAGAIARLLHALVHMHRGDQEAAILGLTDAVGCFDALDMRMLACAARARLATLVGGDEGAGFQLQVDAFLDRQAVSAGEQLIAMLAP